MAKSNQDFTLHQGDQRAIIFQVLDPFGEPYDLTGLEIGWLFSKDEYGRTILLEKSSTDGTIIVDNPFEGKGHFTINTSETENIRDGRYFHEMYVFTKGAQKNAITVLTGNIVIKPSIKKR